MKRKWSLTVFALLCAGMLISRADQESLQQELAQARAATAIYHDVDRAIADGYVRATEYEPGEGFHYANFALIDGVFEIHRPEALLYAVGPNGELRLAGLEYLVPLSLSGDAPEGFTGIEDLWREDSEGAGLWEMNAWLWITNPDGMFAARNPRIP
jgi:hypothetical protein